MGKIIYHKRSYGSSLGGGGDVDSSDIPTSIMIAEFDNDAHMNSADMSNSEIEDFVESLDISAVHAVDYVVEQGTEGIWTYRKWNSGIAECCGITPQTTLEYAAWGNVYEALLSEAILFPTNLFIAIPSVIANAIPVSGAAIMATEFTAGGVTATQAPRLYAIRPVTASGSIARAHIQVKGRWK